jgi:hypothetical protein
MPQATYMKDEKYIYSPQSVILLIWTVKVVQLFRIKIPTWETKPGNPLVYMNAS